MNTQPLVCCHGRSTNDQPAKSSDICSLKLDHHIFRTLCWATLYLSVGCAFSLIIYRAYALGVFNFAPAWATEPDQLAHEDKGIVDFIKISFFLLGSKIRSILILYYGVMLISTMAFCLSYRKNPLALAALACLLISSYQILPYMALNPQLGSPLALRCMPALGLVACLHCLLYFFKTERKAIDIAALILQALIIFLIVHIRFVAVWLPATVIAIGLALTFVRWRAASLTTSTLIPIVVMIAGFIVLGAYRVTALPAGSEQHVIWHNIYSGFALNPQLAKTRELHIDDYSIVVDVARFVKSNSQSEYWQSIGGESYNFSKLNWSAYDRLVPAAAADICKKNIPACLQTFFLYKPHYFADTLFWFYGFQKMPRVIDAFTSPHVGDAVKKQLAEMNVKLQQQDFTGAPWASGFLYFLVVLSVALAILRPGVETVTAGAILVCVSLMAMASLAPSMLAYPAPHGMVDTAIAISFLFQYLALLAGAWLVDLIAQKICGRSANHAAYGPTVGAVMTYFRKSTEILLYMFRKP